MRGDNPKRLTVRYPKGAVYARVVSHVSMMAVALAFLSLIAGVGTLQLAMLSVLFIVFVLVVDVSPLLTHHWLTRSRLVLRQGLLFKGIIPLRNVESVEGTDEKAKVGVKFSLRGGRLFITTSQAALVLIRMRSPQTFRWALGKRADEVVINVEDRERFLREMRDRLALFSPVEAEGPDADLWDEGHLSLVD